MQDENVRRCESSSRSARNARGLHPVVSKYSRDLERWSPSGVLHGEAPAEGVRSHPELPRRPFIDEDLLNRTSCEAGDISSSRHDGDAGCLRGIRCRCAGPPRGRVPLAGPRLPVSPEREHRTPNSRVSASALQGHAAPSPACHASTPGTGRAGGLIRFHVSRRQVVDQRRLRPHVGRDDRTHERAGDHEKRHRGGELRNEEEPPHAAAADRVSVGQRPFPLSSGATSTRVAWNAGTDRRAAWRRHTPRLYRAARARRARSPAAAHREGRAIRGRSSRRPAGCRCPAGRAAPPLDLVHRLVADDPLEDVGRAWTSR